MLYVLIAGLLLGSIYGLLSLGFNLSVGVVRILNFAHGAFVVWAMYLVQVFSDNSGVHPLVVAPVVVAISYGAGYAIQRTLVERVLEASEDSQVLFGFGLLLVMWHGAQMVFGYQPRIVRVSGLSGSVGIGGDRFQTALLFGGVTAVLAIGLVIFALRRSRLGRQLRACADNRQGAILTGLPVRHLNAVAAGTSASLAALAGVCLFTFVSIVPERALEYTLLSLVIVIIGGLGNLAGSLLGGLIIGFITIFGQRFYSGGIVEATIFASVFVILLVRPTGLLGTPNHAA